MLAAHRHRSRPATTCELPPLTVFHRRRHDRLRNELCRSGERAPSRPSDLTHVGGLDRHDAAAHRVGPRPTRAPGPRDRRARRAAAARQLRRATSWSTASSGSRACAASCSCGRWRRSRSAVGVAGRVDAATAVARPARACRARRRRCRSRSAASRSTGSTSACRSSATAVSTTARPSTSTRRRTTHVATTCGERFGWRRRRRAQGERLRADSRRRGDPAATGSTGAPGARTSDVPGLSATRAAARRVCGAQLDAGRRLRGAQLRRVGTSGRATRPVSGGRSGSGGSRRRRTRRAGTGRG